MTGAQPLIYNCFIIRPCSPDNNGVCGVFLIMWHFFALVIKDFRFPLIALKIMTASALASSARSLDVSLLDCITNSLSVSLESREDWPQMPRRHFWMASAVLFWPAGSQQWLLRKIKGVFIKGIYLSLFLSVYPSVRPSYKSKYIPNLYYHF